MLFRNWIGSWKARRFSGLQKHRHAAKRSRTGLISPTAHLPAVWTSAETLEDRALLTLPFSEFLDPHPDIGNRFGDTVTVLSTGNVVITAPNDNAGGIGAGAVYLFNGATGALISTLTGSSSLDNVGSEGVVPLPNGNYLIHSMEWNNGSATRAGAVTFGNGLTGVSGTVSAANSLVGTSSGEQIGRQGITVLPDGNYIIKSAYWTNGTSTAAGAVTWGNADTGVTGSITQHNSLVGTHANDYVGDKVNVLSNGNYVVLSSTWDSDTDTNVGAVTLCNGSTGTIGVVSASNSLVGSSYDDQIGYGAKGTYSHVVELANGNFIVASPYWSNVATNAIDAGAVTWCSGTVPTTGPVTVANSLVGSQASDLVGLSGVTALTNGNYVVTSPRWHNGSTIHAGAVTFGDGIHGTTGSVSSANSLVGTTTNDEVGGSGITALSNGNYVVANYTWNHFTAAVTWADGTKGISGVISPENSLIGGHFVQSLTNGNYVVYGSHFNDSNGNNVGATTFVRGDVGLTGFITADNSLIGSHAGDAIGSNGVVELANGNYLVKSGQWDNGNIVDAGALTFASGTEGVTGVVSTENSLTGSSAYDRVGATGVTTLANGNYVVRSQLWDNGSFIDAGAATWGSGVTGVTGVVSEQNSLIGASSNDQVGNVVMDLLNGNYIVRTTNWDNGSIIDAGAVTFGDGSIGISGLISASNSLVGSSPGDYIGDGGITILNDSNYVVGSPYWDNEGVTDAGAVTFCNGTTGTSGLVSATNSLVGSSPSDYVGNRRATPLGNGNYVVVSPNWRNGSFPNAGAFTFGGSQGVFGEVNTANSIVGANHNIGIQTQVVIDNVNETFLASFVTDGGGRVRVGSQAYGFVCPTVNLSVSSNPDSEADRTIIQITLWSSAPVSRDQIVDLSLSGTAIQNSDYALSDGLNTGTVQFSIPAGQTSAQISLSVLDDLLNECDELITLTILNPTSGIALGPDSERTILIADDDNAGTLSFTLDQSGPVTLFQDKNELRIQDSNNQILARTTDLTSPVLLHGTPGDDVLGIEFSGDSHQRIVTIDGEAGNDSISIIAMSAKLLASLYVYGDSGNDTINGAKYPERLYGGDGDDSISGGDGNDLLSGGSGNDLLDGGTGVDTLVESQDFSMLLTGDSTSGTLKMTRVNGVVLETDALVSIDQVSLTAGLSNNRMDASGWQSSGITTLVGGGGRDTILGSPGRDLISTYSSGRDSLFGGAGNDTIFSGSGDDTVDGGDGDDLIQGQNGNDSILGGNGNDNLAGVAGFDTILGGDGNDKLFGNQDDDSLDGGLGNDSLWGSTGNDTLLGGAGKDMLSGDVGTDSIDGQAGNDRVSETGNFDATIIGTSIQSAVMGNETWQHIERIDLIGFLNSASNLFDGHQATVPLQLTGNGGDDTLLGGTTSDTINGGNGNDVVSGGGGVDAIDGGDGTDYWFESADADFSVIGRQVSSAAIGMETAANIEVIAIKGGPGNNNLNATATAIPVLLLGGTGDDTVLGGSGHDTLTGGFRGDSTVAGSDGIDSLDGGSGTDTLKNDPSDTLSDTAGDTLLADVFSLLPAWLDLI